ncbi:MAG: class I SAM-dependent methyltransferase [Thermodesulfobacteriota bacterium]|nr:class I SAM-dependent methyltransferase [Thermodesulfobacteriota bacterium]
MAELKAYNQAAGTGRYAKASGLSGKYDNVRRFWEDQLTGIFLRPVLNELVDYKRRRLERLRILDLGCGSGDGFDLIMAVTSKDPALYDYIHQAITPDIFQEYLGVDINDNLLNQAMEYYGDNPKMRFEKNDIGQRLLFKKEKPFDVYLSSYGTMSHFNDAQAVDILSDLCRHAPDKAVFVGDWLGRYSYEWQDLWHKSAGKEFFMDYRISYIYPPEERDREDIPVFPLRLMTKSEIMAIINEVEEQTGITIRPVSFFDRSIMVGRHLETGDYNKHCPDLRLPINSLFEPYTRTDLERLLVDYAPRQNFGHLNNFFESFFMCSNTLVEQTKVMLADFDNGRIGGPRVEPYFPEPLIETLHTMHQVVETAGLLQYGDPRANIIEPHLGYSLRKLEMELQTGTGMGHSLVGIFEINKGK